MQNKPETNETASAPETRTCHYCGEPVRDSDGHPCDEWRKRKYGLPPVTDERNAARVKQFGDPSGDYYPRMETAREYSASGALSKLRKQFSVEVWRASGETNERFLTWRERRIDRTITGVFNELDSVRAQLDEARKVADAMCYAVNKCKAQRDELLKLCNEFVQSVEADNAALIHRNSKLMNEARAAIAAVEGRAN